MLYLITKLIVSQNLSIAYYKLIIMHMLSLAIPLRIPITMKLIKICNSVLGEFISTNTLSTLHLGTDNNNPLPRDNIPPPLEEHVYPSIPQLMAGKGRPRKHVQRSPPSNAEKPISLVSTVDYSHSHTRLSRIHICVWNSTFPTSRT